MLLNQMSITTNPNDINDSIMRGAKVIAVCDNAGDKYPGTIPASLLLPPYEAISFILDQDMMHFMESYQRHLSKVEVMTYLLAIVTAMMSGKEIVVFIEPNEFADSIISGFNMFMSTTFGIHPNFGVPPMVYGQQFWYDSNFDGTILILLYNKGFIPAAEFLARFPIEREILPPVSLQQLVTDVNPPVRERTSENYYKYFSDYSLSMKRFNKVLTEPLYHCEGEADDHFYD